MGRAKTTGRFNTRAELVHRVRHLYFVTDMSVAAVARHCGISAPCANSILDSREWESLSYPDDWRYQEQGERPLTSEEIAERRTWEKNEKAARASTCGSGYTLPSYPVHLPTQIMEQIERLDPDA